MRRRTTISLWVLIWSLHVKEKKKQGAVGQQSTFERHLQRGRRTFVSTAANGSYLPTVINVDVSLVAPAVLSVFPRNQQHQQQLGRAIGRNQSHELKSANQEGALGPCGGTFELCQLVSEVFYG